MRENFSREENKEVIFCPFTRVSLIFRFCSNTSPDSEMDFFIEIFLEMNFRHFELKNRSKTEGAKSEKHDPP